MSKIIGQSYLTEYKVMFISKKTLSFSFHLLQMVYRKLRLDSFVRFTKNGLVYMKLLKKLFILI